jgi:hypothetical protein
LVESISQRSEELRLWQLQPQLESSILIHLMAKRFGFSSSNKSGFSERRSQDLPYLMAPVSPLDSPFLSLNL